MAEPKVAGGSDKTTAYKLEPQDPKRIGPEIYLGPLWPSFKNKAY